MRTQDEIENKALRAPRRTHAFEGIEAVIPQPLDPMIAAHPKSPELIEADRNVDGLEAELASAYEEWSDARDAVIRRLDNAHVDPSHDPAVRSAHNRLSQLKELTAEAKARRSQLRRAHADEIHRASLAQHTAVKSEKLDRAERRRRTGLLARGLARLRELAG